MSKEPVVFEIPGAGTPPVTPGVSLPPDPPVPVPPEPPDPAPEPSPPAPDSRTHADAGAILRQGMAEIGLGRHYGNALLDWFDSQGIKVSIDGTLKPEPFRVHSHPDEVPSADPAVFGFTEDKKKEAFYGEGEFRQPD